MLTNILTTAAALSDDDLLARLPALARKEREASADLVAHLAVLDTRPALYAADGYGSQNSRREIEALVAELAPRPDVPSLIRRLPSIRPETTGAAEPSQDSTRAPAAPPSPMAAPPRPTPRPIVEALAPERYRVQFTIGQETKEKLRRLQALLRREIPDGDPGTIFDRAISLLLEKVEGEAGEGGAAAFAVGYPSRDG